ncbi:MAG: LacI family DNA-binding transcriptional regulator [Patulibacter minatonensis]
MLEGLPCGRHADPHAGLAPIGLPPLPDTPGSDPRPTLRTLAERTGLHTSTVSRALRRDRASDPTAALVHAAATELGYRPDPLAAGLRSGRTGAIGMVAHSLTDLAQALIHEEVDQYVLAHGYDVLVAATRDDPEAQRKRVELLLSRRVDGLIIADAHRDGAYADWVATLGVPYVLVMRGAPGHPAITVDDELAGRMVADHLADLGHTRMAHLAGPSWSAASYGRAAGFRARLAERGIGLEDDLVEPGGLHATTGRAAMERLLDRRRDFTAVFCASDFVAFGATSALGAAGLRVGDDVALVGYNDLQAATAMDLTSVRTPQDELGRIAAEALLAAIDGCEPQSRTLAPELVVRGSTAGSGAPLADAAGAAR